MPAHGTDQKWAADHDASQDQGGNNEVFQDGLAFI
jgi:hypothetical protein